MKTLVAPSLLKESTTWLRELNEAPEAGARISRRQASYLPPKEAKVVRLARGRVITLPRESDVSMVQIRNGSVWLTETPGNEDVVLEDGVDFQLCGHYPVVLQALTDVEISLG